MKTVILPLLLFLGVWSGVEAQVETSITVPYTTAASPTFPALLYLPDDYNTTGAQKYPLLVFLHGSGESCPPQSNLYNNSGSGGPSYLIEHGQWPTTGFVNPKDGKTYKFIVVSPQSGCNSWSTSGDQLENIINYLVSKYRVDVDRIYGTGVSAGGGGITEYAAHMDAPTESILTSVRTHKFAAMVPMSLATNAPKQAWADVIAGDNIATWGFGDPNKDTYGSNTMDLLNFMNKDKPGLARFTQMTTGHGPWGPFYATSYRENFTYAGVTANMNIYEWMLISTLSTAPPPPPAPTANAGSNQTLTLPIIGTVTLNGTGTAASGHTIASYKWTQISGLLPALITTPNAASTTITGLVAGAYGFRLTVTDDAGTQATSDMTVTVNAAAILPVANIGTDQTITLPLSTVTLDGSGSTGPITLFAWTQVSGGANTITSPAANKTTVTGLSQGTHVFQLSLNGGISLATTTITVNAAVTATYGSPAINVSGNASIATTSNNVTSSYALTGATLNAMKWTKFSVPGQAKFKIGIIGSSTSVGSGTSTYDSAYAGRLLNFYKGMGVIDSVINLAYSGYNIYQAMPTGYTPSASVTAKLSPADVPDPARNVTAMLARKPDVVIINFPSNGYDVLTIGEIMPCYQTIYDLFKANGIECYITTTQPRQDAQFDAAHQLFLQVVRDSILNRFGSHAINFYDAVATPGTTVQIPEYRYGDDIHLNDLAHRQFFNLVVGANIFQNLISSSAVITNPTSANTSITNLPVGVSRFQATVWDSHVQAANAITTITVTAAPPPPPSPCGGSKYVIAPDPSDASVYITHLNSSYKPGDTIVLNNNYSAVDIEGLKGTNACPIVIMNQGVQALITKRLNLDGCQYVKVTGSGSAAQYGIFIQQDPQLRQQYYHAITINNKSKNVEVERVSMHNVDIGIVCETNEDCDNSLNYPNWVLDSMSFHDNKIVGTWNEGMYIGNTSPDNASYDLRPVTCSGVTSYPAPMKNGYTKIYNNIVDSTGRGGIQLANAAYGVSEVYGNTVGHNGLNGDDAQGTAISVGLYTRAYIHDNKISNTYTWGIASIGGGATNVPLRIENNTIDSSGYLRAYDLATTSRTVYDPRTEPTVAPQLTWPQSIEIDTRTRLYTTDSPHPGTAVKGQDSTQFYIKYNVIGLKKSNIAINVDDDFPGIQKSGNVICGNVNKGTGTPAVINVAAGINYSSSCSIANPPTASAGNTQTITLPANSVTLTGTGTSASGHTITYAWTKLSGGAGTITTPGSATTTVTGLAQGTYVFRLTVTQDDNQTATSDVTIIVNAAGPAVNPPTALAGNTQTITLPANSVTLTGAGTSASGHTITYAWTKLSGGAGAITTPGSATTTVTGLVQGAYVFRLTVTQDDNQTATSDVTINVNAAAPVNQSPTANAGTAKSITLPVSTVTLTGSGSDPDGNIAGYAWTQVGGPNTANIVTPGQIQTVINGLVQGTYTFKLTVTDNNNATGSATVTVTVNAPANQLPTADAGTSQAITLPVSTVSLTGSGTDPDGTIASYAWSQYSGPTTANIATPGQAQTLVTGLAQGVYNFKLTVTDNSGGTATDIVTITVNPAVPGNKLPTANAGAGQAITLPVNAVLLSGGGTDPDGTISSYSWSQLSGPSTATIVTPGQAQTDVDNLIAGVYTFQLTVKDNSGASATASVTITVTAALPPNQAPIADAGQPQSLVAPVSVVTVDASASYDPDGTIVKYDWVQVAGGGGVTIVNANTVKPSIYGLQSGPYTFQLTVTDNQGATANDQVVITVNSAGGPSVVLVANAGKDTAIAYPGSTAVLNGSASYAQNATIVGYAWSLVSGPAGANILTAGSSITNVDQLIAGEYVFKLTVTGSNSATAWDTVRVRIVNDLRYTGTARVYPNPIVQNDITIDAMNSARGKVQINIYDVNGKLVQGFAFDKQADALKQQLILQTLAKGSYVMQVRFSDGHQPLSFKLVKQ